MDSALTSSFLPNSPLPHHQLKSFPSSLQIRNLKKRLILHPTITCSSSSLYRFQPAKNQTPDLNLSNKPVCSEQATPTKRKQSLQEFIFNFMDEFICTNIDSPLHPSLDPQRIFSGFLEPVDELPPTQCEVMEGSLPRCLDGAYIRNGPNPQFNIPGRPSHLFDGDGMLHVIKISSGKATFCSRYVRTYKYVVEQKFGRPIFFSIFSSLSSMARLVLTVTRALAGQFDPVRHGFGTANTSLAYFGGRIFALSEGDLPYEVKIKSDGDIITLGRHSLYSNTPFSRMTAHPKIDHETGEAFAYRFNITSPFLTYFRIDSYGRKQPDIPIFSVKRLTFTHDLALTENYVILPDAQIVFDPTEVMIGKSPVTVDHDKVSRIGILPRCAEDESEMVWINVPGFNMMHCFNAWEEQGGNVIVMVASNASTVDRFSDSIDTMHFSFEKIEINVKAKTVQRHLLSGENLEMGVINPAYATKKNRYVYATVIDKLPRGTGVVKLDVYLSAEDHRDTVVASHLYAPGCCGGEPFFVAREPNNPDAEEDDGYLVTYVHDENINESKFVVMDARSPSLDIIAVVKLPQRVPCGFHGLFISQTDLNKQ